MQKGGLCHKNTSSCKGERKMQENLLQEKDENRKILPIHRPGNAHIQGGALSQIGRYPDRAVGDKSFGVPKSLR